MQCLFNENVRRLLEHYCPAHTGQTWTQDTRTHLVKWDRSCFQAACCPPPARFISSESCGSPQIRGHPVSCIDNYRGASETSSTVSELLLGLGWGRSSSRVFPATYSPHPGHTPVGFPDPTHDKRDCTILNTAQKSSKKQNIGVKLFIKTYLFAARFYQNASFQHLYFEISRVEHALNPL